MLEKGKKMGRKCGAEWLLTEGPIGKGAEHPQDTNFLSRRIFFITPSQKLSRDKLNYPERDKLNYSKTKTYRELCMGF